MLDALNLLTEKYMEMFYIYNVMKQCLKVVQVIFFCNI